MHFGINILQFYIAGGFGAGNLRRLTENKKTLSKDSKFNNLSSYFELLWI
jgi:hypothetical protein